MKTLSLAAALFAALITTASAQRMPPPPGSQGVPQAEELATIPNLTAAQQIEVRKILIERRDAQEAAQDKLRAEFDALRIKERNERERINEQSSAQLRKLLGDDGYRRYAEWDLAHRGPPGPGRGQRPPGGRGERGNAPQDNAPPPDGRGGHGMQQGAPGE